MDSRSLKDIPLFRDISDDILEVLVPVAKDERFKQDGVIFDEGSSSDRFFFISEGEVEIRKETDREKGTFKPIAVLQKGDFFGEMAVFMKKPRSASAVAKTDASLISIGRDDLLNMFSKSPEAAFKMMGFLTSVLMDRLQNTTRELVTVYETGRKVTTAWSMQELSDSVLDGVIGSVDKADAGIFVIWNEFNEEYDVFGQRGYEFEPPLALPEDDPIIRVLSERPEPIVSFDIGSDSRLGIAPDSIYAGGSLVASPFLHHGRLLGFMLFLNVREKDAFSYNHMVLLHAISGYVSVAVENLKFMQSEIDRARLNQGKSMINPF